MTLQVADALGVASSPPSLLNQRQRPEQPLVTEWLFSVAKTFGGTSVQLEYTPDEETTWLSVGVAITEAGSIVVKLPFGATVRVTNTGGTGVSIDAWIN